MAKASLDTERATRVGIFRHLRIAKKPDRKARRWGGGVRIPSPRDRFPSLDAPISGLAASGA